MKTPITILTGFLGSGKSTLLTKILQDPQFSDAAVIVNEFGEVGLDSFLVEHSEEQVMEMTTGCLCCTIRGDISETLLKLWKERDSGDLPDFKRIIVETTGLADPVPVIHTITTDFRISKRFELEGIITTVDSANGLGTLDKQEECLKQVAVADQIVMTKTDLYIDEAALDDLKARLGSINPTADISNSNEPEFDLESLFENKLFDEKTKTVDIQKWLSMEKVPQDHDHHHDHNHGHDHNHHHHHHHDVNKHGDDIETFSLIIDRPVFAESLILSIQLLIAEHGEDILRIKGALCLREHPERPYIIHGVQHIFHEPMELKEWPTDDHRSQIVFITRKISKERVLSFFAAWTRSD